MNETELYKLWQHLQTNPDYDFGTFAEFRSKMMDVNSRKKFYDKFNDLLEKSGVVLGDYDEYEKRLGTVTKPITKLPKKVDPNEAIKNAWFSPLYEWAKTTKGDYRLYENGDMFQYTLYSETLGTTDIFSFYKNGNLTFEISSPKNSTGPSMKHGKWVPNSKNNGFVITLDNGDVFDTKERGWKIKDGWNIDPTPKQQISTTSTTTPTSVTNSSDVAKGENEYYTDNQNLSENLIKKIVSKHLHSVL
jgi:hypothetical protein